MTSVAMLACIRQATEADLLGILEIVNEVVANTTAIYSDSPESPEQRAAWFAARRALGFPVLVAQGGEGEVLGFASFGEFRAGLRGFRGTVEHSVHVRTGCRCHGLGTALVEALVAEARRLGKHVMVAAVDAANAASIGLHEKLGFSRVALMPQVGCKFGRWLDLVLLQKQLNDAPPCD
jgi:phosphinothricin acetyltransferase